MAGLEYFQGYSPEIRLQVQNLIETKRIGMVLKNRYKGEPIHQFNSDKLLFGYANSLKQKYFKNAPVLNKVQYDNKIHVMHNALGLHTAVTRVQGGKANAKIEIRIGNIFKRAPEPFLKMIVVHELAHIKEKTHNKAFYQLCTYMEPNYFQLEFDVRLFLVQIEIEGTPFFDS
ncbi:M48 family metallopeptidase [Thorsellia anophelis]|uniref:YgjP-like metallopeptidase domain-containing protein n=1 Tax=Thorsellia anophelis DSM 18579 TaxID=1123402 RepID=A0A1H9YWJ5_9GAMM|nr:YgjP-like metallopeptidase domain-containing protein [Thorsellia anophelis]SES73563.1 hypothetical protein SAMN02583745_00393 [Thorsellia anophelis DSM 18579]